MQGKVFSLNLVLKYLGLSYLHTKHQTGSLWTGPCRDINKSACVDKREDRTWLKLT